MTTFTVHDDLGAVVEAAQSVGAEQYEWSGGECTNNADQIRCELSFNPWDYREGRYVETAANVARWQVDVTVWLPANVAGPIPFVVYGHGINDRRQSGGSVARLLNPAGIAVIAADALAHGSHPTAAEDVSLAALDFLGIDLSSALVDPLRLRGNFEQTVLDRLQLVELIRQDPDITGDGAADLDIEHVGYWGISLGGMLGAPFAALSADTDAVVLSVAGGRLLTFATDTAQVAAFRPLIGNLVGSEELFLRLLPVAQTVVDAADPATYGATILSGELHAGPGPSLLFPVATEDDTVPPATGRVLARAIGAPQLGHAFFDVETLDLVTGPLVSNISEGQTAAYYQVDRVSSGDSATPATHSNAPLSAELGAQAREFFSTALFGEPPVIIDPLVEFDTPPLP
jgi:dienelactone hydrolase